jgi:hypothetical protein
VRRRCHLTLEAYRCLKRPDDRIVMAGVRIEYELEVWLHHPPTRYRRLVAELNPLAFASTRPGSVGALSFEHL